MNKTNLKKYLNTKLNTKKIENTMLFYGENIEEFLDEILLFSNCILNESENLDKIEKEQNESEKKSENFRKIFLNQDFNIISNFEITLEDVNEYNGIFEIEKNKETQNLKQKNIKVSEIKEFFSKLLEKPKETNKKIYIIYNAENLNVQSQNAILKIIEEPPAFAHIFLISRNIENLLATIKSRCTKIYLSENLELYSKEDKNIFLETELGNNLKNIFKDAKTKPETSFYEKYLDLIEKEDLKELTINLENLLSSLNTEEYYKAYKAINMANERIENNGNKRIVRIKLLMEIYEYLN